MRTLLLILLTLAILAAAGAPAACMVATPGGYRPLPRAAANRISITLENQPVRQALLDIAKQADIGIVIAESVSETRKVTAILKNVPADEAISLIARQAGLTVEPVGEGDTLLVEAKPGSALASIFTRTGNGPLVTVSTPRVTYQPCADAIQPEWDALPTTLVDLRAEDTTVTEAMAKLEKQLHDWRILVDDAVSQDIKVTAEVIKMPFREVMRLLLGQAGLTFSVDQHLSEHGLPAGKIHVVPPPKIEVSGAASGAWPGRLFSFSYDPAAVKAEAAIVADLLKQYQTRINSAELFPPWATVTCPKCGAPMQKDWRFCPKCGAERKQDEPAVVVPAP